MTIHQTDILTETLPADTHPTNPGTPTGGTTREGVNAMVRIPRARARFSRAWDELSETDRRVLLEAARLRRQEQAARDIRETAVWAQRQNR